MADGDPGNEQPSLELPKLSWRRKKRAPAPEPPAASEPPTAAAAPAPPAAPAPAPAAPPPPAPEVAETRPLYVDEAETLTAVEEVPTSADAAEDAPAEDDSVAIKVRRLGGMPAAVGTGVVVGLGMVGLTWASLQGCDAVQGTTSCGKTGYPVLIVILVVAVVLGAVLLRLARVPEPGSTSFLAVGLAAVVALLFFVGSLTDPAMVAVIPVVSALTYALAHWVTRTFIEPAQH